MVICSVFQVDIGSGKGYLGSHLSVQDKFKVVGVDSCITNSHGAVERQRKMKRVFKRTSKSTAEENDDDVQDYKTVTKHLNSRTNLMELLPEMNTNARMMMTGLHACGNLSSCILQMFNRTQVNSLCLVGCCYHHIEERFIRSPFDVNPRE